MAARVVLMLTILVQVVYGIESRAANDGLMDRLSNGMKFAKDFLGSESVALKVAEFVVRAFQTANSPNPTADNRNTYSPIKNDYKDQHTDDEEPLPNESKPSYNADEAANPLKPLRHLVKLFGLQPQQISAVAVNALLFVAQMISTFFSGPQRPGRPNRADEDSLSWILNKRSQRLQDLLATARNESLPDIIEDLIQDNPDEDISCVRLLVCKITPFVSKMQKAVFGEDNGKKTAAGTSALYRHLPSEDEINQRSDICEQKHKDCDLNE